MKKIATLAGVCVTVLTLPALAQATQVPLWQQQQCRANVPVSGGALVMASLAPNTLEYSYNMPTASTAVGREGPFSEVGSGGRPLYYIWGGHEYSDTAYFYRSGELVSSLLRENATEGKLSVAPGTYNAWLYDWTRYGCGRQEEAGEWRTKGEWISRGFPTEAEMIYEGGKQANWQTVGNGGDVIVGSQLSEYEPTKFYEETIGTCTYYKYITPIEATEAGEKSWNIFEHRFFIQKTNRLCV